MVPGLRCPQCAGHGCPVGPPVRQGPGGPPCSVTGQRRPIHLQPGYSRTVFSAIAECWGVGRGRGRALGKPPSRDWQQRLLPFWDLICGCHVQSSQAQVGEGQHHPCSRKRAVCLWADLKATPHPASWLPPKVTESRHSWLESLSLAGRDTSLCPQVLSSDHGLGLLPPGTVL